jgi:hypothetical protein
MPERKAVRKKSLDRGSPNRPLHIKHTTNELWEKRVKWYIAGFKLKECGTTPKPRKKNVLYRMIWSWHQIFSPTSRLPATFWLETPASTASPPGTTMARQNSCGMRSGCTGQIFSLAWDGCSPKTRGVKSGTSSLSSLNPPSLPQRRCSLSPLLGYHSWFSWT